MLSSLGCCIFKYFFAKYFRYLFEKRGLCADSDLVSEVPGFPINLDPVQVELLQFLWLEDVVVVGLLAIHSELQDLLLGALGAGLLRKALHDHLVKRPGRWAGREECSRI